MNLGSIWNKLNVKERDKIYMSVLYYSDNVIHTKYELKYTTIPFNKIIFLDIVYVLNALRFYRRNITMLYPDMKLIETIIRKLKGLE